MPEPAPKPPMPIFLAFLRLGCTSFGGPIAHLGYFRRQFVDKLHWLEESTYAEIVALCQFLPGPSSSQAGFTIGLLRGGLPGAFAAWLGFTLPSAILMFTLAVTLRGDGPPGSVLAGLIHGLQLAAVAVVAQAVVSMARSLTPDLPRALIALLSAAVILMADRPGSQLAAILIAACLGSGLTSVRWLRTPELPGGAPMDLRIGRRASILSLSAFVLLLVLPFVFSARSQAVRLFEAFYHAGALVFGGGHVVLPLLQTGVVEPGWTDLGTFLGGYGFAQALPGPLFTFAAYLGAVVRPSPHGVAGALIALTAIFLPGLLLILGVLPFWARLRTNPAARAALAGINAGVVGILAAALYRPLGTSTLHAPVDFLLAAAGAATLIFTRTPPWAVVLVSAVAGVLLPFLR